MNKLFKLKRDLHTTGEDGFYSLQKDELFVDLKSKTFDGFKFFLRLSTLKLAIFAPKAAKLFLIRVEHDEDF